MKAQNHDRRHFIRLSMLGVASGILAPYLSTGKRFLIPCPPTTPDIIGPFYLANAPASMQMSGPNEPGTPLFITGTVRSENCPAAIPNALVEVWHATDAGAYYTNVNPFTLRGSLYTATDGSYSFNSIQPGWYLNGAQYRPKHLHYKVSAPGYSTLITQVYFTGDQYIANDPWASLPTAAQRIIPLVNNNGTLEGQFDIWLDDLTTGTISPFNEKGVLMQNYPNPFSAITNIYFNVFNYSAVTLCITDVTGRTVKELIKQQFVPGRYQAFWDGTGHDGASMSNGIYLAQLQVDDEPITGGKMILQR